jgi:glycosyltransferase involved in cell wall biosynthesis
MTIRFLVLNAYAVGGTVRSVVNLANALAQAGHDVRITSVWRHRRRPAFAVDQRVRLDALVDISPQRRIRRWVGLIATRFPSRLVPRQEFRYIRFNRLTDRRIVRYLRSLDGGVLITTRPALNLLSARFAPRTVVRVGQEHLHHAHHRPEVAEEIARWYRELDAVSVLTEADRRDYQEVLAGSGTRLECVPNALDQVDPTRSTLDGKIVMSAGRLVPAKGFTRLIKAFAPIARAHPEWSLHIFGSGPEQAKLAELVRTEGLEGRVVLRGQVTRLEDELGRASLFVLSSRREGFGMVLIEAMSHGVPVISFDCPHGPREIITDGQDGLLVPPQSVKGLRAAITRLVEDDDLRETMGERAVEASHRYSADRIRSRWEDLLADLVSDRTGARRRAENALPGVR